VLVLPIDHDSCVGYTFGMKTAISIPDEIFKGAERMAQRTKRSRSQLISDALKEYLARHNADDVTEAMNRVCADVGVGKDEFSAKAAWVALKKVEW
jgi:metal-responsive CopG/Arc/MetJ family transcriptional regulator